MDILWQDIAISIGGAIGLLSKAYALLDTKTVWDRKSSLTNALFYIPSLAAFYSLGLWVTLATSCISCVLWFGIALFRNEQAKTNRREQEPSRTAKRTSD